MSNSKKQNRKPLPIPLCTGRYYFLLTVLLCLMAGLIGRAAYLQVVNKRFYQDEGESRSVRFKKLQAFRGNIVDRNGVELAVTVPVDSVWLNPRTLLLQNREGELFLSNKWKKLAAFLDMQVNDLSQFVYDKESFQGRQRQFVWLKRHIEPVTAEMIAALNIPGVNLKQESRRYYPMAEVTAHLIGFTNVDDQGIDGVEYIYNEWLTGKSGKRKEIRDLRNQVVELTGEKEDRQPGNDLQLSIDSRIQAIAYKELKKAVKQYDADTGALVIMDVQTGEVLAIANQPSYNPNNTEDRVPSSTRNRAFTDVFEPGSTAKPITVLSALEAKRFKPNSVINTAPGILRVGGSWVRDPISYGKLDLAGIIKKSSNVGVAKIALELTTEEFLHGFYALGFGNDTGTGFPGEQAGWLNVRRHWSDFEKVAMSYGYGIAVTPLQLAQAYAIIGSGGVKRPVSILKKAEKDFGEQVVDPQNAGRLIKMMEAVVTDGGTGKKAKVKGYRVSGKTGTVRKAVAGGFGDQYIAVFAGIAPVENPKIAMAVMIDNPKGDNYYGGDAAAPVFGKTMYAALRTLNILPDDIDLEVADAAQVHGGQRDG